MSSRNDSSSVTIVCYIYNRISMLKTQKIHPHNRPTLGGTLQKVATNSGDVVNMCKWWRKIFHSIKWWHTWSNLVQCFYWGKIFTFLTSPKKSRLFSKPHIFLSRPFQTSGPNLTDSAWMKVIVCKYRENFQNIEVTKPRTYTSNSNFTLFIHYFHW